MRSFLFAALAGTALHADPSGTSSPASPMAPPTAPTPTPAPASTHGTATMSPAQTPPDVKLDVQKATLPNGLRIVYSVDHTSPTVAVDLIYDVGSRNEERGHSGFAHLFEHMMFQGSANVARGEHFQLVMGHGGQLNATTGADRTNYFEMLPRSELPLALWLESDRMKTLDVNQKNLENQRAVVEEEYRMRIENAAYVPAELRLEELVYQGYFPYEHPTIGSMQDLEAAKLEWVKAFHDAYYAPNEAVLAIAGDFDPAEATALITTYFGNAIKHEPAPAYDPGALAEQTAPREAMVVDPHAKLPAILDGWAIPPTRSDDHYALEMAALLLSDGESSRLYRALVREKGVAIEVDASTNDYRGPDKFEVSAKLAGKATVAEVGKLLDEAIGSLAKTAPTDVEMTKIRNRMASHYLFGLQSNFARAQRLATFELYWGDANLVNGELARYLAVKKEDVQRVVAKYLVPARRTRVEVRPGASADAPATPATPATPANAATPVAPSKAGAK